MTMATDHDQQSRREPSPPRDWMSRKEAARYLTSKGRKISAQTLANMASNNNAGKGPPYTRISWTSVVYERRDLDGWLKSQMIRVE